MPTLQFHDILEERSEKFHLKSFNTRTNCVKTGKCNDNKQKSHFSKTVFSIMKQGTDWCPQCIDQYCRCLNQDCFMHCINHSDKANKGTKMICQTIGCNLKQLFTCSTQTLFLRLAKIMAKWLQNYHAGFSPEFFEGVVAFNGIVKLGSITNVT